MTSLRIPSSTYRLQFHRRFRFEHARNLVPYLDALGITYLYASPVLQARRGSTHGYDVTDPTR
jgi:(1->4)-alpha-D-glucan 1-alpha-D-glucosylmutase